MRSQVTAGVICATLGGALTAGGLLLTGAAATPVSRPVIQAGPLLASGAIGGTAAGEVYQQDAGGVVAVRARTVPAPPTAFDGGSRDGSYVSGSAAVVGDGLLLTAAHLVRTASAIEVDCGGRRAAAEVAALDSSSDLAILRIKPDGLGLSSLSLGDSEMVRVGDPAVVLGREPGAAPALSAGTIAALQPVLRSADGSVLQGALQVDADLGPADVGGPLLDAGGDIIGITTRMRTAGGSQPIDLAVPASAARRLLDAVDDPSQKVVGG
ncbi:MAG TPA: serine protease [Solirubrobacteraceae bacterium]|jgi:S1-C subfamily serine protease|nr:serine protease [Solirubrobacteraceae bacterium]